MHTKEVSKITGISVQMIHFYEKKGIIKPSRNESNGYRDYTDMDVFRIVNAHTLNSMGIELDEVVKIMDGSNVEEKIARMNSRLEILNRKRRLLDQQINLAGDLLDVFKAIVFGTPYIIRHFEKLYFYPRRKNSEYSKILRENGAGIAALRIRKEFFNKSSFPDDVGTMFPTKVEDLEYPCTYYHNLDILQLIIRTPVAVVPDMDTVRQLQKQIRTYGYLCTGDCFSHAVYTDLDAGEDVVSFDFIVSAASKLP